MGLFLFLIVACDYRASEIANKLFHKAIIMSTLAQWCFPQTLCRPMADELAAAAGMENTAEALRALTAEDLLQLQSSAKLKLTLQVNQTPAWSQQVKDGRPQT